MAIPTTVIPTDDGATATVIPYGSDQDYVIDDDTLSLRASTAELALSRVDPERDVHVEAAQARLNLLKEKLKAGQEQEIRDEIAVKSTRRQVDILRNNFDLLKDTQNPDELLEIVDPSMTDGIMDREASAAMVEGAWSDPVQAAALENQPEKMDAVEQQLYRLSRLDAAIESWRKKVKDQSIGADVGDFAEMFLLPFRTDFFKQDRVKGALGAFLTGNDVENQRRFLMTLDVESGEFDKELTKLLLSLDDNFFGPNNRLALEFLEDLRSQSQFDKILTNTLNVAEFGLTIPITKAVRLLRKPASLMKAAGNRKAAVEIADREYNLVVRDSVLEGEIIPPEPKIGGKISGADVEDVEFEIIPPEQRGAGLQSDNQVEDVLEQVIPDGMQTSDQIGVGLSGELGARLEKERLRRQGIREQIILGPRVTRLSKEQEQLAIAETDERLAGKVENGLLVSFKTERNPYNNTLQRVAYIGTGRDKMQAFPTEVAARRAAEERYGLRPTDYEVDNSGSVFFIKVRDQVNEAGDSVRSLYTIAPEDIPTSDNLKRFLAGADSVLDNTTKARNHFGASQVARLQRQFKDYTKEIRKVPVFKRKALSEVLEYGQTGEAAPKWYTLDELNVTYQKLHGRLPTDAEVSGYYAIKDLNDLDWFLHNSDIHAELARTGFKKVDVAGPAQQWSGNARVLDDLDGMLDNFTYQIDTNEIITPGSLTREHIAELKEQGYKLIDAHENDDLIKNVGVPFRYILAKDREINQQVLDFIQLPYVPGGHRIYQGKFFIKQARFMDFDGQKFFMRPQTHFVARTEGEAKATVEGWEKARQAYRAKVANEISETEATRIISENTYLSSFGDFARMVDEDLIQAETPFEWVFDREKLSAYNAGRYLGSATDELDDIHDWYRTSGRLFYGRKGEHLLDPQGQKAAILNPYRSAAMGINHAMRVSAFGDMTRANVDAFMETFKEYLKIDPKLSKVQNFNRAVWKENVPADIKAKGEAMRKAHQQLIGTPTNETIWHQESMRKISRNMERIAGRKASEWVMDVGSSDPVVALRSFAFNLKLGLFDLSQLLLQAQTSLAALSLDPVRGGKAFASYWPTKIAMVNGNESVIRHLGKNWSKMHGFSEDEFMEYIDDLRRSGAYDVSGNIPIYDELAGGMSGNILSNPATRFLEAGRWPFIEGERWNKTIAFNMAWRKWKRANPGKKLEGREFEQVVRETDLLAINMSRASNAFWQRGVISIPTQFMSYQARLLELMLPKMLGGSPDIVGRQKAQLAIGQFLLYGSAGVPLGDWARERFQEATGEVLDEQTEQLLFDGVWDNFIFGTLGMDTDFAARAGAYGAADIFSDMLQGESFVEIAGGASFSVGNDVLEAFGKIANMRDLAFNDIVEVTPSLVNDVAKNISSWNRANRMLFALETGMYLSSKDKTPIVVGVNTQEAIGLLLGIPLEDVNLYYEMRQDLRENDEYISRKADVVSDLLFQQYRALSEGNEKKATAYGKQIGFIREVSNPRDWQRIQTAALNHSGPKLRPLMEQWLNQKGFTNKFRRAQEPSGITKEEEEN